jgi:hypothetical protein
LSARQASCASNGLSPSGSTVSGGRIAAASAAKAGPRSAGSIQYSASYCRLNACASRNAPVWCQVRVSIGRD